MCLHLMQLSLTTYVMVSPQSHKLGQPSALSSAATMRLPMHCTSPEGSCTLRILCVQPRPCLRSRGKVVDEIERRRPRKELSVGEAARRSGVAVSTLHYYESRGLIRSSRTRGNQRRYPREVLRRIAIIKVAQRAGIPLAAIQRALASLPEDRVPTLADWRKLSTAWKLELD